MNAWCHAQISIEEELATEPGCATPGLCLNSSSLAEPSAQDLEAGALQQEAKRTQWQPVYCALLRLAQNVLKQQADEPADTSPGSLLDAPESIGNAEEAAEDCCAFAHSLIGKQQSRFTTSGTADSIICMRLSLCCYVHMQKMMVWSWRSALAFLESCMGWT